MIKFNYDLSDKVQDFIKDAHLEEISIGCSDSQVFKIKKDKTYFIKIAKKGMLTSEYNKLNWLDKRLSVPKIVLYDYTDGVEYLITEALEGEMVCSDYYLDHPDEGLKVIVEAFKNINSVSIDDCPFDVSIDYKISLVEKNLRSGLVGDESLKEETLKKFGSAERLLEYLKNNRFEEEKCFSHGDTSLPNIFAKDGKFEGFIDVGECGIADKWFDLAICEKSIKRNYGEDYISKFYELLDIAPNREKIDYYLVMMELYP